MSDISSYKNRLVRAIRQREQLNEKITWLREQLEARRLAHNDYINKKQKKLRRDE